MPPYRAPIKSGVHRYACTALFRALFRSTRLENVPQDTQPILRATIAQRFRKNRTLQKLSELQAAFLLGHHILDILHDAPKRGPSGVESLVATILRVCPPRIRKPRPKITKEEEKRRAEAGQSNRPVDWKREGTMSIIDRPLPLDKLKGGIRKVPHYATTSGFAFLRVGKPQSPFLTRILRWRLRRHTRRLELGYALHADVRDAGFEDKWDGLLSDFHGVSLEDDGGVKWVDSSRSALKEHRELQAKSHRERIAQNNKMWDIYVKERDLAEVERRDRRRRRRVLKRQAKEASKAEAGDESESEA